MLVDVQDFFAKRNARLVFGDGFAVVIERGAGNKGRVWRQRAAVSIENAALFEPRQPGFARHIGETAAEVIEQRRVGQTTVAGQMQIAGADAVDCRQGGGCVHGRDCSAFRRPAPSEAV
ncbi:hypothetical protein HMPREF9120_02583 [Neisseria sp. oral taxon 020 str. F0370]|nr:hypothetical protein HMPREF9120_02583 [Neisseria sp. oral taxon 020 str. F0370]